MRNGNDLSGLWAGSPRDFATALQTLRDCDGAYRETDENRTAWRLRSFSLRGLQDRGHEAHNGRLTPPAVAMQNQRVFLVELDVRIPTLNRM
jgi:hypothetical protein